MRIIYVPAKSMSDVSYKARIVVFEEEVVIAKCNVSSDGYDAGYSEHLVLDKQEFKIAMKDIMEGVL